MAAPPAQQPNTEVVPVTMTNTLSHLLNKARRGWRLLLSQQLRLQAGNLPLELPQHGVLGVLINARLVGDVLGPVGVPQRAQGLLVVVPCRANVGYHHRLGVATQ